MTQGSQPDGSDWLIEQRNYLLFVGRVFPNAEVPSIVRYFGDYFARDNALEGGH